MARLERVEIVHIAVRDLAKAEEFYTRVLGFTEPHRAAGEVRLRVPDGARVALWVPDAHDASQVRDADLIGTSTGLGFTTGDLRRCILALRRHGAHITKADPTGDSPYGLHAVVEDPDGNGVMLFQPARGPGGAGGVTGLAFVNVVVQDLRLARGWYQDALGLGPGEVRAEQGWAELRAPGGGPAIGLFQPHRTNYRDEADHEADLAHLGARTGITLASRDVAAWCKEAKQRGVRITAEPARRGDGLLARFADPDGNEFAVAQSGGEERAATRKSG